MRRTWTVIACSAVIATSGWLSSASAATGDRPDTFNAAKNGSASATGQWVRETLHSAGDRDWFRFTVAQRSHALVTLGHLPDDYALAVFNSAHQQVAKSDRSGKRFEEIYHSFAAGDYFVQVTSSAGANPNVPYYLKFRPLAGGLVIADVRTVTHDSNGFVIRGELLNNSATWMRLQRLHITWFNKHGDSVGTCNEGVIPAPIAPGRRIEFDVENGQPNCGDQPAGATSYKFRVFAAKTTDRTPTGLVLTPGAKSETPKQRLYKGTVTNNSSTTLHNIFPTVIEYDRLGRAIAFGYDKIDTLRPGQTRNYSAAIDTKGLPSPNAVRERVSITD